MTPMSNRTSFQPGILGPMKPAGRYLTFSLHGDVDPVREALRRFAALADGDGLVVGIGQSLALRLGAPIDGLRPFPQHAAPGVDAPATPAALWCWLRGEDAGALLLQAHDVARALAPAFELTSSIGAFMHGGETDRDLSGYEDGTENPSGDDAVAAAIADDGGSFVAVQRWAHDFERLRRLSDEAGMDAVIGRCRVSNAELEDAPVSSHVRRTEQESFDPPAFLMRRSMPWADGDEAGLMFVGFGRTLDAFEVQWARMMGVEDGITDALFGFTRPVTGGCFWCPPVRDGKVDLGGLMR